MIVALFQTLSEINTVNSMVVIASCIVQLWSIGINEPVLVDVAVSIDRHEVVRRLWLEGWRGSRDLKVQRCLYAAQERREHVHLTMFMWQLILEIVTWLVGRTLCRADLPLIKEWRCIWIKVVLKLLLLLRWRSIESCCSAIAFKIFKVVALWVVTKVWG